MIRYEIPCDFLGITVHTRPKDTPVDICTDRNIGTWKAPKRGANARYEALARKAAQQAV